MSKRRMIVGAVLIAAVTFFSTLGGLFYLLNVGSGDAASTLNFVRALQIIKSKYVEEVPVNQLMAGAIRGMVGALDDPHSIYMDARMFKEFMVETEGSFGGVGIVVGMKDKILTVVSAVEGTPGDQAGIKNGDQITQIDGNDTKGLALDEAVNKIRGPEGSKVVLTIQRVNEAAKNYTLTRSNIQIRTVAGKMLPDNIGYIRLSMFNESTGADFIKKYHELESAGMKAVILDMRDNPGGLLEESVTVAGAFVPRGPVVSVVMRDGERKTHQSSLEAVKYPVAVLVNGGSASASEIVAGAIQDTGAGTLIGTKTYGKGSVQTVMRMADGAAIKLTIAKYLTPSDRSINGIGIDPDMIVEQPPYQANAADVQLNAAIEVLKAKLK